MKALVEGMKHQPVFVSVCAASALWRACDVLRLPPRVGVYFLRYVRLASVRRHGFVHAHVVNHDVILKVS